MPDVIHLDSAASCRCEGERARWNPGLPLVERKCTIYTLTEAKEAIIELQQCPTCPRRRRRFIGPETRGIGLFNYNNWVLFTHELLDDFTSMAVASETPFAAFVTVMKRRYGSQSLFVGEDLFRSVWFAYTKLVAFGNDMRCTKCGDAPEHLIWDGVTVAFQKKHLLPTLEPPTIIRKDVCEQRRDVVYVGQQQCLTDKALRAGIKRCLKGSISSDSEAAKQEYWNSANFVSEKLGELNEHLRSRFIRQLGQKRSNGEELSKASERFWQQVMCFLSQSSADGSLWQLSAQESILQMINRPALQMLGEFVTNPTAFNASRCLGIPALLAVWNEESKKGGVYSREILGIASWLHCRATEVLQCLMKYKSVPREIPNGRKETCWEIVSDCRQDQV